MKLEIRNLCCSCLKYSTFSLRLNEFGRDFINVNSIDVFHSIKPNNNNNNNNLGSVYCFSLSFNLNT